MALLNAARKLIVALDFSLLLPDIARSALCSDEFCDPAQEWEDELFSAACEFVNADIAAEDALEKLDTETHGDKQISTEDALADPMTGLCVCCHPPDTIEQIRADLASGKLIKIDRPDGSADLYDGPNASKVDSQSGINKDAPVAA
jgi:hypothetical protein